LVKEYYSMKFEPLINATVIEDAIRFISSRSKESLKSSWENSNEHDKGIKRA
jgi:hypothetical protein